MVNHMASKFESRKLSISCPITLGLRMPFKNNFILNNNFSLKLVKSLDLAIGHCKKYPSKVTEKARQQ